MTERKDILFKQLFGAGSEPVQRFHCPGRVNLIGEHIDYLGGLVMPAAISLGMTATCRKNTEETVRVHSPAFNETCVIGLSQAPEARPGHWSNFLIGIVRLFQDKGLDMQGCDVLIESDLPLGSGLSSSAALEVLFYYMMHVQSSGREPDRLEMAKDCQKVENEFIGVNCGIMDQFAVAFGKKDHAVMLDCHSLEHELVPLELGNLSLVIINSNKKRELSNSAYNTRIRECEAALKQIREHKQVDDLVNADISDLKYVSNDTVRKRARHVIAEQLRVKAAAKALAENQFVTFGKLLNKSHLSLQQDYEVSCPELDMIADFCRQYEGCLGARMTGAGFGGCCVALVNTECFLELKFDLESAYVNRFGHRPSVYLCDVCDGVRTII